MEFHFRTGHSLSERWFQLRAACLFVYNIVRKEKFFTTANFPQSDEARIWILYCLREQVQLANMLKSKNECRIPAFKRVKYNKDLGAIGKTIQNVKYRTESRWLEIKSEIKTASEGWEKCAGESCKGQHNR